MNEAPGSRRPNVLERLGADWIAVVVAGLLVLAVALGLLPAVPW